jgi:16S rRNA processing protein RimM
LGIIVRPHGLKGEVKISLTCSGLERLTSCKSLRLVRDGIELKSVSVIRGFMHPDGDAILRFKEVQGLDEAEGLRGVFVAVPETERTELPPDSFFLDDLAGMTVVTEEGLELGQIEEVLENPGNDVCVVRQGEKEILLPVLKSVILNVDLKARRMVVRLPEEIDAETAD